MPDTPARPDHRAVYDRVAEAWHSARRTAFPERHWIAHILAALPPHARVLDLGCGTGHPVAAAFLAAGHAVTGVDFAPAMLAIARRDLPQGDWREGDMRDLDLGIRFHAIIAWDSMFHLTADDQRALIPCLARHLLSGGWLLFTTGPAAGEAWGQVAGQAVWHDSLDPADYRGLLASAGLKVDRFVPEDPLTAGHTVWLAQRDPN